MLNARAACSQPGAAAPQAAHRQQPQKWGCSIRGAEARRSWSRAPVATGRGQSAAAAAAAAASPVYSDAAIRVTGVDLTFTGRGLSKQVLNGACLEVPHGRFHMLLGANGCGKSTLLRVLAGLFRPDAGDVHVDAPCGFVFQNPDHQVVMPTVAADVAFGLGRYRLPPAAVHAAVAHALDQVGLSEYAERPTSSLSGGQKQRVAIAGALAECPRVLLLDELTTFLDYEDQENVLRCVRSIVDGSGARVAAAPTAAGDPQQQQQQQQEEQQRADGQQSEARQQPVTALWVTHRLEELEYADSVSYMDGGRIAFSGTPAEMRAHLRRLGAAA